MKASEKQNRFTVTTITKTFANYFFTDNFNSLSPLFFLSNVHFQSIIFVKYILPYTTSLCFFANIFVVVDILRQRCETQSNRVEGNKQRRLEENELFEIYTNNKQKQKALLRDIGQFLFRIFNGTIGEQKQRILLLEIEVEKQNTPYPFPFTNSQTFCAN